MSNKDYIIIKGASEHNLKDIDVKLPRNKMIVVSGVSGSGKSSLAFDTIYAEGQRRYVESLSSYARQFLGLMEKPHVDYIEGLSPAISIEQKTTHRNPRSTVATVTEIYDYLRLLFARIGKVHCYSCGRIIESQSIDSIIDQIMQLEHGSKMLVLSPVARGKKGEFQKLFEDTARAGFVRVRVDGEIRDLSEEIKLKKNKKHDIDIVVDRLVLKDEIRKRLGDSVESALEMSSGLVSVLIGENEHIFSENFACVHCGISYPEIAPRLFSFNNPFGACEECHGLGEFMEFDLKKIIPDETYTISEGAIKTHLPRHNYVYGQLKSLSKFYKFSLDTPWNKLDDNIRDIILNGSKDEIDFRYESKGKSGVWEYKSAFKGIMNDLKRRHRESSSNGVRDWLEGFMTIQECSACHGKRLNNVALSVLINDVNIHDFSCLSVSKALEFIDNLQLSEQQLEIGKQIIIEIKARLKFLNDVGLGYLTLERKAATLSGGEAQRIRLATQIGSKLVGVLYILDEPTIGLHQRDNDRLLSTLLELRDLGNTLIVVEHDEIVIRSADYVVELGPGAGEHGGRIVAEGLPQEIIDNKESLTGQYLAGYREIEVPVERRKGNGNYLTVKNAVLHNLKDITVNFPLGKMIVITGVSGSGKSTLINDILYPVLHNKLNRGKAEIKSDAEIEGIEHLDKVINIDQSPIGRTPRSNPATYVGLFTYIRELFAEMEESKVRGYKPGRFSFNVKGGRCENCSGDGEIKIEMHFLPDVYVKCDTCNGKRYNRDTLDVKYKGYSIADVLAMTVEEALELFSKHPKIRKKLETLMNVGLGYIKLGQSALTLSGGEAQRVKLSLELSKRQTGKTLYILDEPTTGLHFADVHQLTVVLNDLVNQGNTMIIIEHNLDIIKQADYIVDLGPEGGEFGGNIVARGTPEDIVNCKESFTGKYLRTMLEK